MTANGADGRHAVLEVRVTPRARRDEIAGEREGVLIVRVSAPPEDGRANRAVRRLIAERLSLRLADVALIRGERSRQKVVRVDGLSIDDARRRLLG